MLFSYNIIVLKLFSFVLKMQYYNIIELYDLLHIESTMYACSLQE